MTENKTETIKKIIQLLESFLKNRFWKLDSSSRKNPLILHYIMEIIRNWNKVNFIIKKTSRALNNFVETDSFHQARLLYCAFRIVIEHAPIEVLCEELNIEEKAKNNAVPDRSLLEFLNKLSTFSWEIALKGKSRKEKLSIKEAIPTYMIERLNRVMSKEDLVNNIKAMNKSQAKDTFTVFLVKNVAKTLNMCFFTHLQREICSEKPMFVQDQHIPEVYHVPQELMPEIIKSELFLFRDLVILDKASAFVANILNAQPEDLILDMCAAPGIKTLLLSHYTKYQSNIIAVDFSRSRVKKANAFLKAGKNKRIFLIQGDSIKSSFRRGIQFDKILLDAPCTGSGALLSHPELKWRQNSHFLHQNTILQQKLLKNAITLLKPSGILVYSTCSLYAEEGEMQILNLLDHLEPVELPQWSAKSYKVNGNYVPGTRRLFPSQHGTQGFFIGKFKKKEK